MNGFDNFEGLIVPINRSNVDTDAIIPKQYMKSINKMGLGRYVFDEWRYQDIGEPGMDCAMRRLNPDFVLNRPVYMGASVILARENFGCGSSREHAVWALADFGIKIIIAQSFGDIFLSNCTKNGILPIQLPANDVKAAFDVVMAKPGLTAQVDLKRQVVSIDHAVHRFDIAAGAKRLLLEGGDEIAMTLARSDKIRDYERRQMASEPWLFSADTPGI